MAKTLPLLVHGRFQCGQIVAELEGAKDGLIDAMQYWAEVRSVSICKLI